MSGAAASVVVAVFGLVCGSFLNAVIHRLPRGIGLSHPPVSYTHLTLPTNREV